MPILSVCFIAIVISSILNTTLLTSVTNTWTHGLLLFLVSVITYLPSTRGGFIWDDDAHLTANPCVVGPEGVLEIWTTAAARICPMTLSSFWLQHKLWGLQPMPYHLVTIAMHAANAVVLWRALTCLQVPGAWFAALLWSIHPVQVESVAWITELKNTQSGLFYFLAIFFYVNRNSNGSSVATVYRQRNYWLALIFAFLAMTSKSSTVILPLVLALCVYWQKGRWRSQDAIDLIPFFFLAVLAGLLAVWTQELEGAMDPQWDRSLPERIIIAGKVVWFYIGTLMWPHPLMFVYPKWKVHSELVSSYIGFGAACLLFIVLWWNRNGRLRPMFFAFSYFCIALLPVLGIIDHFFLRYSYVGDHFQYLPSVGIITLMVGLVANALRSQSVSLQRLGITFGCILAFIFGTLSWRYEGVFANDERLWRDTLAKNPSDWLGHNNLGVILFSQGDLAGGFHHYNESLKFNPYYERAHNNLGVAYSAMGNHDAAITHCSEALRINPSYAEAHYNLGNALAHQQRFNEAIEHYTKALLLKPRYSEAHNNLGSIHMAVGNFSDSLNHLEEAVRLNPNNESAKSNLLKIEQILSKDQP